MLRLRQVCVLDSVLLCPRCGIYVLNFNRSTVFLIFFCGLAKIYLLENQLIMIYFKNNC